MKDKKIINKAYRLLTDLKVYPFGIVDKIGVWIDEGLTKELTQEEWREKIDNEMLVVAKKGAIFFESKLFRDKDDDFYLYPQDTSVDDLNRKDISLGLGMAYENNKFILWRMYLRSYSDNFILKKRKQIFAEIKTEELSFEQIHMVSVINSKKEYLEEEINKNRSEIDELIRYIKIINNEIDIQ